MADLTPATFCDEVVTLSDLTGKAVAINRGNCTFSEKARNVQHFHGEIALIVSQEDLVSCKDTDRLLLIRTPLVWIDHRG